MTDLRAALCLIVICMIGLPFRPLIARAEVPPSVSSPITRRVALVIGNAGYEYNPLKNSVHDADAIAAALTRLGFTVTKKTNLKREEMIATVNSWGDTLNSHTLALVYFSGHGIGQDGNSFLVPIDNGKIKNNRLVSVSTLPLYLIQSTVRDAHCPLSVFILDACSSSPFPQDKGDSGKTGLTINLEAEGQFIAYATRFGETASDNSDGQYSLYTESLLHNMETPGISIEQLFNRVRGDVKQKSENHQIPEERSQLVGEFCINGTSPDSSRRNPTGLNKAEAVKEFIGRGDEASGANKYMAAAANYTLAIEADPQNADAYTKRSGMYLALHQYATAITDASEAIRLQPDSNAVAYNYRGLSCIYQHQYDKALADLSEAIRIKTDFAEAYNNRAFAYTCLKEYEKAIVAATEAIRIKPDDAEAYVNRGSSYISLNQLDKAIQDLNKAVEFKPALPEAHCARSQCYLCLHQFDKAVADSSEAIRLAPDLSDAYLNRGISYTARLCCIIM